MGKNKNPIQNIPLCKRHKSIKKSFRKGVAKTSIPAKTSLPFKTGEGKKKKKSMFILTNFYNLPQLPLLLNKNIIILLLFWYQWIKNFGPAIHFKIIVIFLALTLITCQISLLLIKIFWKNIKKGFTAFLLQSKKQIKKVGVYLLQDAFNRIK